MQLLGDGYEIPEMTKLHGLLLPSRFAQRSASSVDRRVGDSWPRRLPLRRPDRATQRSRATGAPGAGPPLLRFWDRWSMSGTSVGVFKVNAHIATQANPHWGMQAGPRGLAHMCGLLASAH